ncbi:hypothetical protein [Nocardia carnea]|uniref:hypothetical protein n=1 Tax=Nocardia carnea TaxID=37328 RepID=UPI002456B758|nr:hypothetical protein [Nocardia carnea]
MSRVDVVTLTLTAGAETVPDMRFYYNRMDIRPERRDVDGWSTSVELAGVVQLLDAVAAGDLTITDMRTALVGVADELERRALTETGDGLSATPETMRCFGDCPRCEASATEVRAPYSTRPHTTQRPGLPHLALTFDEYDRWRAEHTGPAGGLRYRLCKVCDPDVPLA